MLDHFDVYIYRNKFQKINLTIDIENYKKKESFKINYMGFCYAFA